jgi:hypothetical protein
MRAVLVMACAVAVACSTAQSGGGEQPEGVGDGGGVHADAPREIADAIDRLEAELSDPTACDYFATSMVAWLCMGDQIPVGLVAIGGSWSIGCGTPTKGVDEIAALCAMADVDESALYCAAYAASQAAFVCCLEGTSLYGPELAREHVCD